MYKGVSCLIGQQNSQVWSPVPPLLTTPGLKSGIREHNDSIKKKKARWDNLEENKSFHMSCDWRGLYNACI